MFKPLMEHTIVNKGLVFYLFIIFIHRVKVKSLESNTSYWPWNQGNMKITISIVCYAVFSSFNTKSEEVSEAWSTPDKLEELGKILANTMEKTLSRLFFFELLEILSAEL